LFKGPILPSKIILLGDSFEEQCAITNTANAYRYNQAGYFWWANTRLNGYFDDVIRAGVGGDSAEMVEARLPAILAAHPGPATMLISGGTNVSSSAGKAFDTIKRMYAKAIDAGKTVILKTVPPRASGAADFVSYTAYRKVLNPLLRAFAANNSVLIFDLERAVMNPGTDAYYEAGENGFVDKLYTTVAPSGVHLSGSGGNVAGNEFAHLVADYLMVDSVLPNTFPGRGNKLGDMGIMSGVSGSTSGLSPGSIMPNGWAKTGTVTMPAGGTSSGTIVTSVVTPKNSKIPGKLLQVDIVEGVGAGLSAGSVNLLANLPAGSWSEGEPLSGSIYVEIDAENFGGTQQLQIFHTVQLVCVNSSFATLGSLTAFPQVVSDGNKDLFEGGVIKLPAHKTDGTLFTIPLGTAYVQCWIMLNGIGRFRFGNFVVG
jgi:lysophospholipase L1-like esterase